MSEFVSRHPLNVPGRYYFNARGTDCDLCRALAPDSFRRDDVLGFSYVFKQPTSPEEVAMCEEAVSGCPTDGVGNDGEKFDWETTLIFDWDAWLKYGPKFGSTAPLVKPKKP